MRNTVACVPRLLYLLVVIFAFEYTTCILACSLWFITKKNLHIKKQKKNWKFRINVAIASSYMSRASCRLLLPSMVSHQLYVIKSSSQLRGAIQAVVEFVTKRGHELVKIDVSRFSYLKISVVLKDFRILELCVYLLLFFLIKKLWMQLCVYLLISRLPYFFSKTDDLLPMEQPNLCSLLRLCNWEAFTFGNSWCCILLSFRFINLPVAIVSTYFLLNCLLLCWINYAVILFLFGGSFVS